MNDTDKFIKSEVEHQDLPLWLMSFIDVYQSLSINNLDSLKNIYQDEVYFEDPMHKIKGFKSLERYFEHLYTHLSSCEFVITDVLCDQNTASIYWEMRFIHKKLNKGREIFVEGHSCLKGDTKGVYYHRDYVDLGVMLYENIPLLGKIIKTIKKRAVE